MMYRIPRYKITLVRDGSQPSEVKQINSPQEAVSLLRAYLEGADREHFCVALLDIKNRVIGINTVSVGSLNATVVHPREVFKPAVLANAAGVILFHNHPSGDPTPSREDVELTGRMVQAGDILGICVHDHLVVTEEGYASLKELGFM